MKIIKKLFNNVDIVYNICYIIIKIKENFTSNCLYKKRSVRIDFKPF
mgnify:CR=1 FL=1